MWVVTAGEIKVRVKEQRGNVPQCRKVNMHAEDKTMSLEEKKKLRGTRNKTKRERKQEKEA